MKNKENNSKTLKWVYKRVKKFLPGIFLLSVISAISSLIFVFIALISKRVLDIATGASKGNIMLYGAVLFGVIILQVLLSASSNFCSTLFSSKMIISIRDYMFSNICSKKYSELTEYHSGDLLNRMTSDVDVIVNSSVSIIPATVSIITKIIAGIGTLLVLNSTIAVIILVIGISVPAIGRMINKRYKYIHKECQKSEGKTRSFLQECFENIVVIKSFISEEPFLDRLNIFLDKNFRLKMKRIKISITAHLCLYSLFTFGYYGVLLWGANEIAAGVMTYGTLMAFLQLISQLRAPLQNVSGVLPQYYSALASAERLIEIVDKTDDISPLKGEQEKKAREGFNSLEINDVTFAYAGENILRNCSVNLNKGNITAITGESGSGKSTLFKLILCLYDPQEGNITVNGETELDASLRCLFSYVPQGNMVLSGSIRDNLTLCNSDVDEEKIINATKAADIYDYIVSLPDGFDTVLNERGAGLSEGQIQRISIARAIIADAPVMLLDEATSALDEETETKVLTNIKNMTGKTVLFITHRNTSLKACDSIIRVENRKFVTIK